MVKGRRKSRSKSSGDFSALDCDDRDNELGTWRRITINGEVSYVLLPLRKEVAIFHFSTPSGFRCLHEIVKLL